MAKLAAVLAALVLAACSTRSDDRPAAAVPAAPAAQPAPAQPAAAPAANPADRPAVASMPSDFPPECAAYAELIDKLRACDRLGAARDGLLQGYETVRVTWINIPPDRRADVATQCKAQADSVRSAAAATCGW